MYWTAAQLSASSRNSNPSQHIVANLVDKEASPHGVGSIDQPASGSHDARRALDGRSHRPHRAQCGLSDQATLERTGAEKPLGADRLIESELPTGVKHRHHSAGTSASW